MRKTITATEIKSNRGSLLIAAWTVTLLISLLPDILFRELTGALPAWLFWAKVALIAAALLISLIWSELRELRLFFAALLAIFLLGWGVDWVYQSLSYSGWFAGQRAFLQDMFTVQIPRLTTALLLVLIMLILTRRFDRFFLVKGNLNAEAAPIPLITSKPTTWRVLGPAIAGAMCLGLLVFIFVFGSPPHLTSIKRVLPLLPFILLFAASNAFGEEMLYRAPWLGVLEAPVGAAQALLITAVNFGIAHFYGVPYGVLGVVMAFIPGWLMGKAILETRGLFWAWFIHFCMDIVVFFFIALGSVTPGG
ncbi:MAG: CPBP family intramembrane glutamic endopeptidase [Anaerolineales bacterium]